MRIYVPLPVLCIRLYFLCHILWPELLLCSVKSW